MFELFVAFSAGLISFLSPCVLPLIPGYISYISGSSLNELIVKKSINLVPIILFTVGFSVVFIIFGAASTFLGQVLLQNSYELRIAAGLLIIILSLHIIGIINLKFLSYEKRIQTNTNTNFYSPILIGMAFAFGWTPCIGPLLVSILVLAQARLQIKEISPKIVKKTVTGYGSASKDPIKSMIEKLLNIIPKNEDSSDALAIAISAQILDYDNITIKLSDDYNGLNSMVICILLR